MENAPQTDEMIRFSQDYEARKKKMGGVKAFFSSWWDNPSAMTQFSAQSLGNMYASATSSEEAALLAAGGAAAGGTAGSFVPVIGTVTGGIAGGTVSYTHLTLPTKG